MGQYAFPCNVEGSRWQHDVNPSEAYDGRLSENLDCFFNCSLWNIGSETSQIAAWDWHGSIYYNSHRSVIQKSSSFPLGSGVFELFMKIVSPPGCEWSSAVWLVCCQRTNILTLTAVFVKRFFEFFRYYCAYLYICIDICIVLCGLLTLGYRLSGYGIGKGGVSLWGILWKMKRSVRFLTAVDSAIVCFFTSFRRVADGNFATSVPSWIIKCTFADRIFRVPNWLQNAVNGALEEIWPVFG